MTNNKFFSKTNIYPTIWAIIVGLLAFMGGLVWKSYTGPDEVVILNRDNSKDTTITVIQFKPDQEYFNQLTNLTRKSVRRQFAKSQTNEKKINLDSLTLNIAKEYQLKFDSLRLNNAQAINPITNDKIVSTSVVDANPTNSKIKKPKFKMPSTVGGYVEGKVNSFASIALNATEFSKKEKVNINLEFFNKSTLDKITPVFIDLVEPKGPNSVYQVWSEQYEINELKNIIIFSADFKPGKYILTIGFYLIDGINTKYPVFYSKKYNIEIK
jgi:hypothetical protein